MKKFYLILTAVTALSLVTLSCTKELADPSQQEQIQKEEDPAKDAGEEQTIPEGMISLTFGVSQEGDAAASDEDTKTSWNGTTHAWSDGDKIRILWGTGENDYFDAEVVDGKVTATVADAENYYAVYPTTATYALDLANGKVTITIPRYQTGAFADANIMAAKTAKADANLEFKNMTSIIKFTTGSTYSYNSVSFMANDQTKLTGTVSTTFPASFDVTSANGSESIVCIQKGNPSGNEGVSAGGTYYLAMLPGAAIDNGVGFKIEQRDGSTDLLGGGISKSSFARNRAKIYDMGTLDSRIVKDWYISESGTGTGASFADPAGPERLMDLLNPAYSTNNTTAGWRLTGATIHVLPGSYNLQALNGGEVFAPHYNLSNNKVYIKGEGTAANPAKFICNQTAATDRIFAISESNKVGDFTFENITFAANGAILAPGIAFDFNSSVASNITFKNCEFTGFVQEGTVNGGPVYVRNEGAANITFDSCSFTNNSCNVGGGIYIYNKEATVNFANTVFSANVAQNGGSMRARAGKVTITDCVFTGLGIGDENGNTAKQGGALFIDGANVTISGGSIRNCKVNGNSGAIYFASGTLEIDGCVISDCVSAAQGGGIAMMSAGKTAAIRNCTFNNLVSKSTENGGGAIYNQGTMTIENCTFSSCTAKSGAAIYTVTGSSSSVNKAIVFNSVFKSNIATGGSASGSAPNGGCIYGNNYNSLLFANCTFSDNTVGAGGVLSIGRGTDSKDYNKLYVVSCTVAGASPAITRTSNVINVYNSILPGPGNTEHANVRKYYTILNSNRYSSSNTDVETGITFALGTYSNGVYPLVDTYSDQYNQGMSASDIQALAFDNITLTDDQKALLAKDQKGNKREGTIMGAYVKTTAPTE